MGTPFLTRSSILCTRLAHYRGNAGKKFSAMVVAGFSFRESRYLTCSCPCWNVDCTSRSPSCETIVPGQNAAPARTFRERASRSSLPMEGVFSPALLHPHKTPLPAPVNTATDVVEGRVSTTSDIRSPISKISNSVKTEYREDVLSADHAARAARLIDSDMSKKCAPWSVRASR